MANVVYPIAKERLLDWAMGSDPPSAGATLCVIGVKASYVYSAGHSTLADIAGGDIVCPEAAISGVTLTNGVVNGDDVSLAGMSVGQTMNAFVVYYKWASTTLLLAYMDSPSNGSLPQAITSATGLLQFAGEGIFSL